MSESARWCLNPLDDVWISGSIPPHFSQHLPVNVVGCCDFPVVFLKCCSKVKNNLRKFTILKGFWMFNVKKEILHSLLSARRLFLPTICLAVFQYQFVILPFYPKGYFRSTVQFWPLRSCLAIFSLKCRGRRAKWKERCCDHLFSLKVTLRQSKIRTTLCGRSACFFTF